MRDTVDATPIQALRVRVIGPDGKAASGAVVQVEAKRDSTMNFEMLAAKLGVRSYQPFLSDTTDEEGVLHLQVKMGRTAGVGRLLVSVPAFGLQDTARFEIVPGAPAAFHGIPIDQAVSIGGTLALDVKVSDRYGNPRTEEVTYSAASPVASVAGKLVTGTAFGRAIISIQTAGMDLETEAVINVVPLGSIAFNVRPAQNGQISAIYTANLDGSELTELVTTGAGRGAFGWMTPAWLSSTELVYSDEVEWYPPLPRPLYRMDVVTGETARLLAPEQRMEIEHHPRVSQDRQWVIFSGGSHDGYWLYRVRGDGTGFQRISPPDSELSHWTPAPSPDGSQVAYALQGSYEGGFDVIDVATGAIRHIAVRGEHPRWSPDGSQIAYVSDTRALRSVKPDGTGDRLLTAQLALFSGGIDWSPDGKYIVAEADYGKLAIVAAESGEAVAVAIQGIDGMLSSPVWRPEAP